MRLIDADALKKLRHDYIQGRIKFNGSEYDLIDKCPTIEAEPVVRCKDCKLWESHCNGKAGICQKRKGVARADDFCSYGERRGEDG